MALTNIEYGSLANSETLNKNFMYLDNRISETVSLINTSVSSILSNIATINSRLGDLSEEIQSSEENCSKTLEETVTEQDRKTTELINQISMLPNWAKCISISQITSYTAPSNGYVLINPYTTVGGNLTVNGVTVLFKTRRNENDNASQMVAIPVKENDILKCTTSIFSAYFLPAVQFTIETDTE